MTDPIVQSPLNILVVDDEVNIRKTLSVCLETEGHKVIGVSNFQDALAEASRRSFELVFVDLRLGTDDGLDLIPALIAATPWLKIIVIGRSNPKPFWEGFWKNSDIAKNLIKNARGVTVIVLDTREEEPFAVKPMVEVGAETAPITETAETKAHPLSQPVLSQMLTPRRIVIWDYPVQKEASLRSLVETASKATGTGDFEALFDQVMKREEQGSTFFNEGVAFPHVRVNGLNAPVIALGLTRQGVLDVSTEKPIEIIFLILSPAETPDTQVQVLGLASRAAQNRYLLLSLQSCQTPEEVLTAIRNWEMAK